MNHSAPAAACSSAPGIPLAAERTMRMMPSAPSPARRSARVAMVSGCISSRLSSSNSRTKSFWVPCPLMKETSAKAANGVSGVLMSPSYRWGRRGTILTPLPPGSLKTLFTCELVSDRVRGESVHQLKALSRPGDLSLRSVGESFVGEALESYRLLSVLILGHFQPPVEHRADQCVDLRNLVFPTIQFRCPMGDVIVEESDPRFVIDRFQVSRLEMRCVPGALVFQRGPHPFVKGILTAVGHVVDTACGHVSPSLLFGFHKPFLGHRAQLRIDLRIRSMPDVSDRV